MTCKINYISTLYRDYNSWKQLKCQNRKSHKSLMCPIFRMCLKEITCYFIFLNCRHVTRQAMFLKLIILLCKKGKQIFWLLLSINLCHIKFKLTGNVHNSVNWLFSLFIWSFWKHVQNIDEMLETSWNTVKFIPKK